MTASLTYVRPDLALGAHPIETGRYCIATPPVCVLYDVVKQWILNRSSGVVYGKQRFGKTWAMKYLTQQLANDFDDMPIYFLPCRDYRLPSENSFFEDLLRGVSHAFTGGKPAAKRNRLVEFLDERARSESGRRRLVIILDEAQKLHELHYRWLVDTHNELDERGVSITWILSGQEELLAQRDVFLESQRNQLIGRFMVHVHRFPGLESLEDFRFVLQAYDDPQQTEHPSGSEWSFTRYFFPAAFANGWRLAEQAETLWQCFQKVRIDNQLPGEAQVPMQYFAGTVDFCLRSNATLEEVAHLSPKLWHEAILSSGYREAAIYV